MSGHKEQPSETKSSEKPEAGFFYIVKQYNGRRYNNTASNDVAGQSNKSRVYDVRCDHAGTLCKQDGL